MYSKFNIVALFPKRSSFQKFVVLLWLLLQILFLTGCTRKEIVEDARLEEFTSYLDNRIPKLMKNYNIPGVTIALVKEGKVVWTNAYGFADKEKGRKITVEDHCRVESISKSVTAWGVMKLVEQGKIELDNPLAYYLKSWKLPESKFSEEEITIRQLLNQTSGMPLGTVGVHYSPKEATPSLRKSLSKVAILFQKPGTSFSYSNTGFNLLELLIEEVTGKDFASYMKEEILLPLGMKHSSFTWGEDWEPKVPNGYDSKGNAVPVYVYPDKASGGLFSSVNDIAKFITAGMTKFIDTEKKVLSPQSIQLLYTPSVKVPGLYGMAFPLYGFGHFIEVQSNGTKIISNGGQGSGWMSEFYAMPETGDGIVILSNSQRSWPFFSYILSDWAKWNGISSVGMGKIVWATKGLWIIIGLILVLLMWQLIRLVNGIVFGHRKFKLLSNESLMLRMGKLGLSIALISGFLWVTNQEYFFMFSVFPVSSYWLLWLMLISALILLLSVLFPLSVNNKNIIKQIANDN